jgi:hypothetical protein
MENTINASLPCNKRCTRRCRTTFTSATTGTYSPILQNHITSTRSARPFRIYPLCSIYQRRKLTNTRNPGILARHICYSGEPGLANLVIIPAVTIVGATFTPEYLGRANSMSAEVRVPTNGSRQPHGQSTASRGPERQTGYQSRLHR